MKKLLSIALCTAMVAALAGCSATNNKTTETTNDVNQTTQATVSSVNVEDFNGDWLDSIYSRCHYNLTVQDNMVYGEISWADSAMEEVVWKFYGPCESDSLTVNYDNCVQELVTYADDGGSSHETMNENGTGKIYIDEDGFLHWEDDFYEQSKELKLSKLN